MTVATAGERGIGLVLFDVDGVLTDNSLHFDGDGEVLKSFNARDGVAVALLRAHGIRTGIVSGRTSPALRARATQLDFDVVRSGDNDKFTAVKSIADDLAIDAAQIAYVGDDVIDLQVLPLVAMFLAPVDAHPLVLAAASHVLQSPGGRGAGREAAEFVLQTSGRSLEEMYAPLLDRRSQTQPRIVQ